MPWSTGDACRFDKATCGNPKKSSQWAKIANSVLRKTGSDAKAIKTASGVVEMNLSRTPLSLFECMRGEENVRVWELKSSKGGKKKKWKRILPRGTAEAASLFGRVFLEGAEELARQVAARRAGFLEKFRTAKEKLRAKMPPTLGPEGARAHIRRGVATDKILRLSHRLPPVESPEGATGTDQ